MKQRPNYELSGKQRRYLRALSHHLDPLVRVGHQGLSESLGDAVFEALETHELIKVRVLESAPVDRKEAGNYLAERCGAHCVGGIGRIAILYRQREEKPVIQLPRR